MNEKIIVISGGAGTLGTQFALSIASKGGTAILADINLELASHQADIINDRALSGRAVAAAVDITDRLSLQSLIKDIEGRYGLIDAYVNNAYPRNQNYGRKLEDVEYSDFCENVSLHLGGYFLAAQQFGVYFSRLGKGNIVNIASIYGVIAPKFEIYSGTSMTMPVEYAAIKSGVIHLTKYFAKYYGSSGVKVNCISPGGILDDQPEVFLNAYSQHCLSKGMLVADDIVGSLIFLLSDQSKYMNGQNLVIDDGFSL